jgi:anti-sigma regulatory factor (Ser/Thr protein kinase)
MVKPMPPREPQPNIDISLASDLSALPMLAQAIQEFGTAHALSRDLQSRLNLVLDELVTNSVCYALPDLAEPELRLRLFVDQDTIVAQLEDNGEAYNPFEEAPEPDTSLGIAERPIGGLGIFFVKKLTDSSTYERIDGRNRITLKNAIGGQASDE